ncbi:TFIID-31kDa-domain-containing protein, partial [Rhizodiscina lignyota]
PPTTQASQTLENGAPNPALPAHHATSATDAGLSKRPRDARIIHLLLTAMGVKEYQERVPLQLLDFAYRYTAGVLSDALALSAEGYGGHTTTGKGARADDSTVSLTALRLAISSRMQYQFNPALPKEFQADLASERNKIALPRPEREWGLRLPPERYCLTGVGWGVKDEWESEGEADVEMEGQASRQIDGPADEIMGEGGEEVNQEEFEDVMGVGGGGDQDMAE